MLDSRTVFWISHLVQPNCNIILDPEDGAICDEVHSKTSSSSSGSSSEPSQVAVVAKEVCSEESTEEYYYTPEETELSQQESVSSSLGTSEVSKASKAYKLVSVPGIGGVVKPDIVQAVLKYLKEIANKQNGMIMPRIVKHFMCPPLEECY